MKAVAQIEQSSVRVGFNRATVLDTTFVLFFLGIELGTSESFFAFDTLFMALTLGMVMVLPYFLSEEGDRPAFSNWVLGRFFIATFAVVLGMMFKQALGTVFPETLSSLPLTLLVITAMLSCYIQFYSFFKFRLAK